MRKYLTQYTFSLSSPLEAQEGNLPSTLGELSYTTPDALSEVNVQKVVNNEGKQ